MTVLEALKTRREYVANQIAAIIMTGVGGKPNAMTADGGTTIDHVGYLDSLYRELEQLDAAIIREDEVQSSIEGSDPPWEIESQVYS